MNDETETETQFYDTTGRGNKTKTEISAQSRKCSDGMIQDTKRGLKRSLSCVFHIFEGFYIAFE